VSSTQLIMSAAEDSMQPQSVAVSRNGPDGNATAMCQELLLKRKSPPSVPFQSQRPSCVDGSAHEQNKSDASLSPPAWHESVASAR
jgi:hypothetical protein